MGDTKRFNLIHNESNQSSEREIPKNMWRSEVGVHHTVHTIFMHDIATNIVGAFFRGLSYMDDQIFSELPPAPAILLQVLSTGHGLVP